MTTAVFSYQTWVGVKIDKLIYEKKAVFGPRLLTTMVMPAQRAKIESFEKYGYKMTNGYRIHGKVFSDPNDNSSGVNVKETNVVLLTKEGVKGAIVVFPTGESLCLSSKSWKPVVEHFKV